MPRKPARKTFNFNLRNEGSSQENAEENTPDQESRTSPGQETQSLARPTRASKEKCLQNLSVIISEERSYDLNVKRERSRLRSLQRVATESSEQREHRLEDMRQRASRRMASESVEQREKRLEDMRQRASQRIARESVERREHVNNNNCIAAVVKTDPPDADGTTVINYYKMENGIKIEAVNDLREECELSGLLTHVGDDITSINIKNQLDIDAIKTEPLNEDNNYRTSKYVKVEAVNDLHEESEAYEEQIQAVDDVTSVNVMNHLFKVEREGVETRSSDTETSLRETELDINADDKLLKNATVLLQPIFIIKNVYEMFSSNVI